MFFWHCKLFFHTFLFWDFDGFSALFFFPSAPRKEEGKFCLSILTEKFCLTHERVF